MSGEYRTRVPVDVAPGRTLYVEDMNSREFEVWTDEVAKAVESRDVGDSYARTVAAKVFTEAEGDAKPFASWEEAREALSFYQLDLLVKEAAATSVQAELAARFRNADREAPGVEVVPDGPDIRVPSARAGNGKRD